MKTKHINRPKALCKNGTNVWNDKMGKVFVIKPRETFWIPYGSIPLVSGLCRKLEENVKKKQLVHVYPQAGHKRNSLDFAIVAMDLVFDLAAVKKNATMKTRMLRQFILQESRPKSFCRSDGFKKFKETLESLA